MSLYEGEVSTSNELADGVGSERGLGPHEGIRVLVGRATRRDEVERWANYCLRPKLHQRAGLGLQQCTRLGLRQRTRLGLRQRTRLGKGPDWDRATEQWQATLRKKRSCGC